jgi:two-component system, LuxR family, sensor kinase FixL
MSNHLGDEEPSEVKPTFLGRCLPATRHTALITAIAMILGIVMMDVLVFPNISLGLLYFLPIVVTAGCLSHFDIVVVSVVCTLLHESLGPFAWTKGLAPRLITTFMAYLGTGALIREMDRYRKRTSTHARELAEEVLRRETTEQQLRGLVEGMPAAILTLDSAGNVLLANEAAHDVFAREPPSLVGECIDEYLPDLAKLRQTSGVRHLVRTMIEGTAYRYGGEAFLAHIWVSSFGPPSTTGLTVVVFDASEQLRTHEEVGLHSLTTSARVIMGAFWHETRNLCSAMRVLVNGLMHRPGLAELEELEGLNSLVDSLEKLAYAERQPASEHSLDTASVRVALDHLRIVMEPSLQEKEVAVYWRIEEDLPLVRADHHGLLQVFLNLARNASRALEGSPRKELRIVAALENQSVKVRFHNSGPSIANPESLFKPFQPGASEGGLGLYVSRAMLRSFGGDVAYEPVTSGCCFTVVLEISQFWYRYRVESSGS